jgi:mycothiol synthase
MQIRPAVDADRAALRDLFASSEAVEGREAMSEHKRLRVLGDEVIDLVGVEGDEIVGYAQAAWHGGGRQPHWALEIVSAPDADASVWPTLLDHLATAVPPSQIRYVWVSRDSDLAHAKGRGWVVDRSLHEMYRSLEDDGLPIEDEPGFPPSLMLRSFRRGLDEVAWLEAHNASFAGHPEVGGMTRDELEIRLDQEWFDAEGFLLVWERDRVVGSCWTKLHEEGIGEIYLIGLRPGSRGTGLGRKLVLAGLHDLAGRQRASEGMLWVDGANQKAVALYEKLGFHAKGAIYRLAAPG